MKIFFFLLFFIIYIVSPAKVKAQRVLFETDFSNPSLSMWQSGPNTSSPYFNTACQHDGNYGFWRVSNGSLNIKINGQDCRSYLLNRAINLQNLDAYTFEFDMTFREPYEAERSALFNWQDENNYYYLDFVDGVIKLGRIVDGQKAEGLNAEHIFNPLVDQSVHVTIWQYRRNIRVSVTDPEHGTANNYLIDVHDETVAEQVHFTVGFAITGKGEFFDTYFDNVKVASLRPFHQLYVNRFMQTDAAWGAQEYDHANNWSENPTIKRWGCALSSLAMIFDYHGIKTMPDGSPLNPSTLNSWLKAQVDGYVGEGLINWMAVTRLTKILYEQFGTTKLEYARVASNIFLHAVIETNNKKPSILEIPGHFLVNTGYNDTKDDLLINDPAYDYKTFSEHETEALSLRKFQPSNTDLSYLLFVKDLESIVNLSRPDGKSMGIEQQRYTESLQATDDNEKIENEIITFQKPLSGEYEIRIWRKTFGKYNLQFFAYDIEAKPLIFKQSGYVGTQPLHFKFSFDKDNNENSSPVVAIADWDSFMLDLSYMRSEKQLKSLYAYLQLAKLAQYAKAASSSKQLRYANYIENYLSVYKRYMSTSAYEYLFQQLQTVKSNL